MRILWKRQKLDCSLAVHFSRIIKALLQVFNNCMRKAATTVFDWSPCKKAPQTCCLRLRYCCYCPCWCCCWLWVVWCWVSIVVECCLSFFVVCVCRLLCCLCCEREHRRDLNKVHSQLRACKRQANTKQNEHNGKQKTVSKQRTPPLPQTTIINNHPPRNSLHTKTARPRFVTVLYHG